MCTYVETAVHTKINKILFTQKHINTVYSLLNNYNTKILSNINTIVILFSIAVKEVFSSVAPNYDLMNDLMSAGVHICIKQCAHQYISTDDYNIQNNKHLYYLQ